MTLLVACGLTREAKIIRRVGVVPVAGGGDAARLEDALEDAITGLGPFSAIISSGIAGALDPALKPGDVVVGTLAPSLPFPGGGRGLATQRLQMNHSAPMQTASQLDPGLYRGSTLVDALVRDLPHAHLGTMVGSDMIAATIEQKRVLRTTSGALAVGMESHVAARVAARHNLPFAIVRTISDAADHVLPPAALVGMKPDGGVALGKVLASLARQPAQLPALIRTGRDAGQAFTALERVWASLGDLTLSD